MSQKIIVISQPRFMPALNYLHRMMLADQFVYLDTVQYTPRDWENRNKIKTSNGESWLSVPVIKQSREQKIQDTRIDNEQNWAEKQLKTLQQCYAKAPFYKEHSFFLEETYAKNWEYLADINEHIVEYACDYLEIECNFIRASSFNPEGSGEELLINICNHLDVNIYMSGSLGRNYIHAEKWQKEGIGLFYHDYEYPEYPQINGDFLPWMGFIDLFMNCGKQSREIIMQQNIQRSQITDLLE